MCSHACSLLSAVSLRFVDDFYAADRSSEVKHAKKVFAMLVEAMLGKGSVSTKKLQHGNPLEILGLETTLSKEGVSFRQSLPRKVSGPALLQLVCDRPSRAKVAKWCAQIERALACGRLTPGEASKLAGGQHNIAFVM